MYVISSRRKWLNTGESWTVLQTGNALPPTIAPQSNYLPAGFTSSLQDPLVILIHGYANREKDAFRQYATEIGTGASGGLLAANGFHGSVIGYDWPSFDTAVTGPLQQYASDLQAAGEVGAPSLADFLNRLIAVVGRRGIRINLMAHSMGNFVVRQMLIANPSLAQYLDNIISFGADFPYTDLERPELKATADALTGNWFVYWSQADFVLLSLSNWANIILGNEHWGGQRLGQAGPRDMRLVSPKVIAQEWDVPLAKDLGSMYNRDLREWPFNAKIHSLYWSNGPFLANVAQNLQHAPATPPITVSWPLPPRP